MNSIRKVLFGFWETIIYIINLFTPKRKLEITFFAYNLAIFKSDMFPIWETIPKKYKKNIVIYKKSKKLKKEIKTYRIKSRNVYNMFSLKGILSFIKSKYIITTHNPPIFKSVNQIDIELWHGIPMKDISMKNKNIFDIIGNLHKKIRMGKVDYFVVTSRVVASCFRLLGWKKPKYLYFGEPRTDILFKSYKKNNRNTTIRILQEYIYPKIYMTNKTNIILYLPTFREYNIGKTFSIIKKMLKQVNLPQNTVILIKLHTMEKKIENKLKSILNKSKKKFVLLSSESPLSIYELFKVSNMLISDYSSVVFDYLITEKPIILFIPDLDEYSKKRGFLINPEENWLPWVTSKDYSELERLIKKQHQLKKMLKNKIKYVKNIIGDKPNSSKKICKYFFN